MDKHDTYEAGKLYHLATSLSLEDNTRFSSFSYGRFDRPWQKKLETPEVVREIRHRTLISLPKGEPSTLPFSEVLKKRASVDKFRAETMRLETLSSILETAAGITRKQGDEVGRAFPSAGNLQSVELFVVPLRVDGLACGSYRYVAATHSLGEVRTGNFATWAERVVVPAGWAVNASVIFMVSVNFERLAAKYEERSFRLGYLDAGHVSQNLLLACTAKHVACRTHGSIASDTVDEPLGISGYRCSSVLAVVAGTPA